ncbi:GNAT family N-acetyltransferase [Diaphorobacter sp. HDW4B]|uniref:GNAT family N-acetyltransferase n=1 Tax=Diaphorobacter sp. HDW4B TaxID=2714925 RepID=UPI00140C6686|nr:GNAT family protein [Diaphorobacter sp. HDW4B]QIL69467.1 GNAT family N-acetyltransferase [Diaphorobacter sp. HDW4B]
MSGGGFTIPLNSRLTPAGVAAHTGGHAVKPVHLESEHLITRNITAADVTPEFTQWFNDANMLQGLNLQALNFSVDSLRAFVASFDNVDNLLLGIFHKADGQLLGFYNFSINARHRLATLTLGASPNIKIGREIFWESWFPICDEMFDRRGVDKITSRVLTSNRRLVFAVLNTEHFIYEGTLKQEILATDGSRLDVMVLSAFKDPTLRPKKKNAPPAHSNA